MYLMCGSKTDERGKGRIITKLKRTYLNRHVMEGVTVAALVTDQLKPSASKLNSSFS